jgi:hypothetical protein
VVASVLDSRTATAVVESSILVVAASSSVVVIMVMTSAAALAVVTCVDVLVTMTSWVPLDVAPSTG